MDAEVIEDSLHDQVEVEMDIIPTELKVGNKKVRPFQSNKVLNSPRLGSHLFKSLGQLLIAYLDFR